MRILTTAVLLLTGAAGAWAQRFQPGLGVRSPITPGIYGSPTGFGNILFPGTPFANPFTASTTFANRFGATISGFPGFNGARSGFGRRGFNNTVVIPYAYPVFVGGYGYGYDNGYGPPPQQQQQPNVTIVMPQQYPAQAAPPVTINQNFVPETAKPAVRQYGPGAQEQAPGVEASPQSAPQTYYAPTPGSVSEDQVLFLIPLKDNTVYTALAYWVEDGTLHYITSQGKHNQVSVDLVDRDMAAKLNQGRQVEFRLPPPKQ